MGGCGGATGDVRRKGRERKGRNGKRCSLGERDDTGEGGEGKAKEAVEEDSGEVDIPCAQVGRSLLQALRLIGHKCFALQVHIALEPLCAAVANPEGLSSTSSMLRLQNSSSSRSFPCSPALSKWLRLRIPWSPCLAPGRRRTSARRG